MAIMVLNHQTSDYMSWLDNGSQLIVGSSYVLLISTNRRLSLSVRAVEADPRAAMITQCPAVGPAYTGIQTNGARPRAPLVWTPV